jgi:hypothetical protein
MTVMIVPVRISNVPASQCLWKTLPPIILLMHYSVPQLRPVCYLPDTSLLDRHPGTQSRLILGSGLQPYGARPHQCERRWFLTKVGQRSRGLRPGFLLLKQMIADGDDNPVPEIQLLQLS